MPKGFSEGLNFAVARTKVRYVGTIATMEQLLLASTVDTGHKVMGDIGISLGLELVPVPVPGKSKFIKYIIKTATRFGTGNVLSGGIESLFSKTAGLRTKFRYQTYRSGNKYKLKMQDKELERKGKTLKFQDVLSDDDRTYLNLPDNELRLRFEIMGWSKKDIEKFIEKRNQWK